MANIIAWLAAPPGFGITEASQTINVAAGVFIGGGVLLTWRAGIRRGQSVAGYVLTVAAITVADFLIHHSDFWFPRV